MAKTLNDLVTEMTDADKAFELWYSREIEKGRIPLEFAGSEGKRLMNNAFGAGGTTALLGAMMRLVMDKAQPKGGE